MMSGRRPDLDDGATFVGIVLGMIIGALYSLFHIKRKGSVRRKDLTQFGAGTAEIEMEASLQQAKQSAKARLDQRI